MEHEQYQYLKGWCEVRLGTIIAAIGATGRILGPMTSAIGAAVEITGLTGIETDFPHPLIYGVGGIITGIGVTALGGLIDKTGEHIADRGVKLVRRSES